MGPLACHRGKGGQARPEPGPVRWLRPALWLSLLAALLLSAAGSAQEMAARGAARREANLLRVNNRPTVLMWARGLSDAADLDTYLAAGFNTAYLLVADPSDDGLAAAGALASAAEAKGLFVVMTVTPAAVQDSTGAQMSPDPKSDDYAAAVNTLTGKLAKRFGPSDHPKLLGWSVEGVPPNGFPWSDTGFRTYLRDWYGGSIADLNRSWGSDYAAWTDITAGGANDLDSSRPAGVGRARVDLAYYRQQSYADALDLWAKSLRAADPGRLVFASALPDYRSIISVPGSYDGMILNTYPAVAEQDWLTHNVHAVDIARRANQFAAVPTFLVNSSSDANQLANWMNEALLHGATGLALSDWSAVKQSDALQAMVKQTADAIATTHLFPVRPFARFAIVYEPIAGGATRNGRGLYGYLDGLTPTEPTTLFAVTRLGTEYGQMDVLAESSLRQVDLQQYGAIFAPMAFYLTDDAQVALHDFVLRGGALVVDAGVGMYQGDGTINSTPPVLTELLGMRYSELAESDQPSEYGSLGEKGQAAEPGIAVPVGPGEAGLTLDPDVAKFADILGQFLSRPDVRKYLGADFVGENGPGFRVRGLGTGFAVYAPTFLYANWNSGDPYFDEFHQRILSWRRDVEVIEPEGVWPAVGVAVFSDWSIAVVSPNGNSAIVDAYGAKNQMYQVPLGAMRLGNPQEEQRVELLFPGEPLAVAVPVPIYLRVQDAGALVTASVSRYEAKGIELMVHGNGAEANVSASGVQVNGGDATSVEIEIRTGAYPIARGSLHHVTMQEGPRLRPREMDVMPNPDTGALVIQAAMRAARVTIVPAPESGQ